MGFWRDLFNFLWGVRTQQEPVPAPVPVPQEQQPAPPPPSTPPAPPDKLLPFPASVHQPIFVASGPFHPRMYSYYANGWVDAEGTTYIFASRVYQQPVFFRVDVSGRSVELGNMGVPYAGETEFWGWDRSGWINVVVSGRYLRHNPFTHAEEVLIDPAGLGPFNVHQAHSSRDGRTHCGTLLDRQTWQPVGTVVVTPEAVRMWTAQQELDESDIDESGRFVVVKEGKDNRVIALDTDHEYLITDQQGAVGHSGMGDGFMVGEENQTGQCVVWDLRRGTRTDLFATWNMGHLSVRGDRVLVSHAQQREIALVDRQTGEYRVIVPAGHVSLAGWDPADYDSQVRANLSPCGRRAVWLSDHGHALWMMEL